MLKFPLAALQCISASGLGVQAWGERRGVFGTGTCKWRQESMEVFEPNESRPTFEIPDMRPMICISKTYPKTKYREVNAISSAHVVAAHRQSVMVAAVTDIVLTTQDDIGLSATCQLGNGFEVVIDHPGLPGMPSTRSRSRVPSEAAAAARDETPGEDHLDERGSIFDDVGNSTVREIPSQQLDPEEGDDSDPEEDAHVANPSGTHMRENSRERPSGDRRAVGGSTDRRPQQYSNQENVLPEEHEFYSMEMNPDIDEARQAVAESELTVKSITPLLEAILQRLNTLEGKKTELTKSSALIYKKKE
ncbi:hypothetical protein BJ912DRAFT_1131446 [Pholiota molesta]|nr:hypothetical protein BJ912DRAFT_1131446 [Pholiota molesta]